MQPFAFGFSPKLTEFVTNNRPRPLGLDHGEILTLTRLAGLEIELGETSYNVWNKNTCDAMMSPFRIEYFAVALEDNIYYIPKVVSNGAIGLNSDETVGVFLSKYLSELGFKDMLLLHGLEEPIVTLPNLLVSDTNPIFVMCLSEFREKYQDLYPFLKKYLIMHK